MKNNKAFFVGVLLIGAVLIGAYSFGLFNSNEAQPQSRNTATNSTTQADGWREQIVPNIGLRLQK